jgi:hypothetical protein
VVAANSLPKAVVDAGRALLGGHSAFALEDVRELADRVSGDQSLREETYLVRNYAQPLAWCMLALAGVTVVSMILVAAQWLRGPTLDRRARTLGFLAVAWLLPLVLFVTWWEPVNPEFWIAIWIPAAILLALPLSGGTDRRLDAIVGVLLASLALVTLLGGIAPQLVDENDYWRERNAWFDSQAGEGDVVVTNGFIQSAYARYFGDATVVDVDEWSNFPIDDALVEIDGALTAPGVERVLISKEAFFPATDEYSSCKAGVKPCLPLVDAFRERYEPRAHIVYESPLETVWELDR